MAKNKDQDRQPGDGEPKSRADQVRSAVEQAFGATTHGAGPVRERAQELADELVGAASRFREVLEELRPPTGDELSDLGARLEALERRVAELEQSAAPAPAAATTARPRPRAATRASAAGAKGASASAGASTAKRGPRAAAPDPAAKPAPRRTAAPRKGGGAGSGS